MGINWEYLLARFDELVNHVAAIRKLLEKHLND